MPLTFDLSKFSESDITKIENAIYGANMAATDYPETWQFIADGNLIRANRLEIGYKDSPIAAIIFRAMEPDHHSGATASITMQILTRLVRERFNLQQDS
jgi:hypothetical protein